MVGIGADIGDRLEAWLNTRHPWVMTLIGTLFFLITGGVAALAVDIAVRSRGTGQLPFVTAGAIVGFGGAVLWLYAFARGFDVPPWIGRTLLGVAVMVVAAALGAIFTGPPLQVLCASIVAARLLPQSVFAVVQWVQDVRDPRGRGAKAERAMTMAYRK